MSVLNSPPAKVGKISDPSRKGPGRPEENSRPVIFLSAIVLLALALRLYSLATGGVYIDEIFSIFVATGTGDPELARIDAVRPVYFALLKIWMVFSKSEAWMKLLSVFFSMGSVFLTYMLGRMAAGRRVGIAACLVMALSPMEIYYAQQIRMYALGTLTALLGSIYLMAQLEAPSFRTTSKWAVSRLLMLLTLPLTATMLAADAVNLWISRRRVRLIKAITAGVFLVFLCWLPFGMKLFALSSSFYDSWRDMLVSPQLTDALRFMVNLSCTAFPAHKGPPVDELLLGLYVLMLPCLLVVGIATGSSRLRWCAVWALLPLSLMYFYSHFASSIFVPRYLMFVSPYLFIVLAAGWSWLWDNRRRLAILAGVIYSVTIINCLHFAACNPVNEDWRAIANFFQEHEKAGDIIAITGRRMESPMRYFYAGNCEVRDLILRARSDGRSEIDLKIVIKDVDPNNGRIWLLSRQVPQYGDLRDKLYRAYKRKVAEQFRVLEHHEVTRMDIYLVEPRSHSGRGR